MMVSLKVKVKGAWRSKQGNVLHIKMWVDAFEVYVFL